MAAVITILLCLGASLPAQALAILVPAYFHPSGSDDWNVLAQAARRIPLVAILNPNSGPGNSPGAAYTQAIAGVRNAGGQVIGYIHTSYTARALAVVKADVDRYHSFYNIDGFFVDEMTNGHDSTHLAYYEELYRYVKSKRASYWMVGNPGINAPEIYITRPAADTLVTFESNTGYAVYRPDAWTQTRTAASFSHLCYAVGTAALMTNYVQLAHARNAGYIYVTDDVGANPWDRLPLYWDAEIGLIEQFNQQSASNRPPVLSIYLQTNQIPELTVRGAPGRYVLQASTNLVTWQSFHTNLSATGIFTITDGAQTNRTNRLYRTEQ